MKKIYKTPNIYTNNPDLYLDNAKNDEYGKVLRNMSAEVLNQHLGECNDIARENFTLGYDFGFRNGLIMGTSIAIGVVGVTIGGIIIAKQLNKNKKASK